MVRFDQKTKMGLFQFCMFLLVAGAIGVNNSNWNEEDGDVDGITQQGPENTNGSLDEVFVACVKVKLNSWTPEKNFLNDTNGKLKVRGHWSKCTCGPVWTTRWPLNIFNVSSDTYKDVLDQCKAKGYDTAQPWIDVSRGDSGDGYHAFLIDGQTVAAHYVYRSFDGNKFNIYPASPIDKCGNNGTWFVTCARPKAGSNMPERKWLQNDDGSPTTVSGEDVRSFCKSRGFNIWMARIEASDYSTLVNRCQKLGYQTAQPAGMTKDSSDEGWHPFQVGSEIKEHYWYHWFDGVYEHSSSLSASECDKSDGAYSATVLTAGEESNGSTPVSTGAPEGETWFIGCARLRPRQAIADRIWLEDEDGDLQTITGQLIKRDCPARGSPASVVPISLAKYNDLVSQCQAKGYKTAQPSKTHDSGADWFAFLVDGKDLGDHYFKQGNISKRSLMMAVDKC